MIANAIINNVPMTTSRYNKYLDISSCEPFLFSSSVEMRQMSLVSNSKTISSFLSSQHFIKFFSRCFVRSLWFDEIFVLLIYLRESIYNTTIATNGMALNKREQKTNKQTAPPILIVVRKFVEWLNQSGFASNSHSSPDISQHPFVIFGAHFKFKLCKQINVSSWNIIESLTCITDDNNEEDSFRRAERTEERANEWASKRQWAILKSSNIINSLRMKVNWNCERLCNSI